MNKILFVFYLLLQVFSLIKLSSQNVITKNVCTLQETFFHLCYCNEDDNPDPIGSINRIYLMYEVNPSEGFNLRRDVYLRLAVFVKTMRKQKKYKNMKLVLPPFHHLYHWKTLNKNKANQKTNQIFWNTFFDMLSLRDYTEVLDTYEYFSEIRNNIGSGDGLLDDKTFVHDLIRLHHFPNMFEAGVFTEKYFINKSVILDDNYNNYRLPKNVTYLRENVVSFQGNVMQLDGLFDDLRKSWSKSKINPKTKYLTFFLTNAEIVLHNHWGDAEFWSARRSMRFNKKLFNIAAKFRKDKFKSTDISDAVQFPKKWKDEIPNRNAVGGAYVCAHLRRGDFLIGRENTTPTMQSAAKQIRKILIDNNLNYIFVASDWNRLEKQNLRSYLSRFNLRKFDLEDENNQQYKLTDGEIAIIDQIICSRARYFIGTYESTFTYRIYEEREILGFPKNQTFNTFCKHSEDVDCPRNSIWPIVY